MIQRYFQTYDKMIFPAKFDAQIEINRDDQEKIDDFKQCFSQERKNNMFLRLENFQEQKKICELQKEILVLSQENLRLKNEMSKNADYILKMEKMIQKLKVYNKYKSKFENEINKNFGESFSNISNENKIDEYEKIKRENKSLKSLKITF